MMAKFDGDDVDDTKTFEVMPEGEYNVFIESILLKVTKNGDEMWALKLVVSSGKFKEQGFYDNIVWSDKNAARVRIKQFLKCFGVYEDGKGEYKEWELEGKSGRVKVVIGEYKGNKRNEVPFNGYYTYKDQDQGQEQGGNELPDDVPF